MLASFIVLIVSTILFVYWFRFACLLVLSRKEARDYRREVAAANNLNFIRTREALVKGRTEEPEMLADALDRDYEMLVYLLQHTFGSEHRPFALDQWLLRLDYKLMRLWYLVAGRISDQARRDAVLEMTSVLGQLANRMGERTAALL